LYFIIFFASILALNFLGFNCDLCVGLELVVGFK